MGGSTIADIDLTAGVPRVKEFLNELTEYHRRCDMAAVIGKELLRAERRKKMKIGDKKLKMSDGSIRTFGSKKKRDNFERVAKAVKYGGFKPRGSK